MAENSLVREEWFSGRAGVLTLGLAALLVLQDSLMLRLLGWLLVLGIVLRSPEKGMVLCFFFAPLFWHPLGSFKLVFTLKPFQLAFFLTFLACLVFARGVLRDCLRGIARDIKSWPLLGFLLSLYLAIVFNQADPKSVRLTLNLTLLIAWFFLASGIIRTPALFLACLKSYLAGSALVVAGISFKGIMDSGYSIFEGHTTYANFLIMSMPLVISFFVSAKRWVGRSLLWLFFLVSAYNLCMSFSRAAMAAFAVIFSIAAVFFVLKRHGKAVLLLVAAAGLAFSLAWKSQEKFGDPPMLFRARAAGFAHMVLETAGLRKKVPVTVTGGYQKPDAKRVHGVYAAKGTVDAALKFRKLMRQEAILSVRKNPWLGKGLYLDGHNLYADLLYSAGYPGTACFVLFLAIWCYDVVRFMLRKGRPELIYPALGVFSGVVGWLIQSWVETYLLLFYIWAFLAVAAVFRSSFGKTSVYEKQML